VCSRLAPSSSIHTARAAAVEELPLLVKPWWHYLVLREVDHIAELPILRVGKAEVA
jgi:hypothetical protein